MTAMFTDQKGSLMLVQILEAIKTLHVGAYDLLIAAVSTGSTGSS